MEPGPAYRQAIRGRPAPGSLEELFSPAGTASSPVGIVANLSVNVSGMIDQAIRARRLDGEPSIPDLVVERLYDTVRDELLRRGKKV